MEPCVPLDVSGNSFSIHVKEAFAADRSQVVEKIGNSLIISQMFFWFNAIFAKNVGQIQRLLTLKTSFRAAPAPAVARWPEEFGWCR